MIDNYVPRFWLTAQHFEDLYWPSSDLSIPTQSPYIRFDTCLKCEYELCPQQESKKDLYYPGYHNLYYSVSRKESCDPLIGGALILKRDRKTHYSATTHLGVDPYFLNEITTLFYLQSLPEYQEKRWSSRFSFLEKAFFCDSYKDGCRIFPQHDTTLRKWREEIGETQSVPFLDLLRICNELLLSLQILEEKKIVHRGITPENVFINGTNIVLGGWSHASFLGAAEDYLVDNLRFTSITSDPRMVDRIMLANTLYFLLYQDQPPHIRKWNQISNVEIEDDEKEALGKKPTWLQSLRYHYEQKSLPKIQATLSEEKKFFAGTNDPFLPPRPPKTNFELAFINLIQQLCDVKKNLSDVQRWFQIVLESTLEYRLEKNKKFAEEIKLLPSIHRVLDVTNQLQQGKVVKASETRECKDFNQIFDSQSLSDSHLREASSEFFSLKSLASAAFPKIPDLIVCTANIILRRFHREENIRNDKVTLKFPSPQHPQITVEIIHLFYVTCFLIAAKLYGILYLNSQMNQWMIVFLNYLAQKDSPENFTGPIAKLDSDTDENLPEIQQLKLLLFQMEASIITFLKFNLVPDTYRRIFEGELCSVTRSQKDYTILAKIQFPEPNHTFLVLDLALFYPAEYRSWTTEFDCETIQTFAKDLVLKRTETLFFFYLFQTDTAYFIDDSDTLMMFAPTLLPQRTDHFTKNTTQLTFREDKAAPEVYGEGFLDFPWFSFFKTKKPDIAEDEKKKLRKNISMRGLSGRVLHFVFFDFTVQTWTLNMSDLKEKAKKWGLESQFENITKWIPQFFNKQNIISFNIKLYMLMALKSDKFHQNIRKDELDLDVLDWFLLLHSGQGRKELSVETVNECKSPFNIAKNKEVNISPFLKLNDVKNVLVPFSGDHISFVENKDLKTFKPTLQVVLEQQDLDFIGETMLLSLATQPSWMKKWSDLSDLPEQATPEEIFVSFLSDIKAYSKLTISRWSMHLYLLHKYTGKLRQKGIFPNYSSGTVILSSVNEAQILQNEFLGISTYFKIKSLPVALDVNGIEQWRLEQLSNPQIESELQKEKQRICSGLV